MAQQEHSYRAQQLGIAQDVLSEVAAHAAAREHTDRARELSRHAAGTLQRLPGDFVELAVLRIQDGGFPGAEAEELRVKLIEVCQRHACRHIVRVVQR